ncbi:MAG: PEP-CTERM sorting domain-containing protein [Sphaerospermopsis sp. SIO1G2]|nr:PEP-CTERM sorting domain-containing protein [Sphaerospermopsis sp. SIO1G2]
MKRLLPIFASLAMVAVSGGSALGFSLVGSELGIGVEVQSRSNSELFVNSFPVSAIVSESAVEFPNAQSLFNSNNFPGFIVNTAIDADTDYLSIDFDNAGFGRFLSGFKNTYVFTFTAPIALQITDIVIDASTTLGLTPDRVTFDANQLFVNVQGLRYDSSSFARINLSGTTVPNPSPTTVPEPGSMLGLGILALGGTMLKRRNQPKTV